MKPQEECNHNAVFSFCEELEQRDALLLEVIRCPVCGGTVKPCVDDYNADLYLKEVPDPRENYMGAKELRNHLQDYMRENVGVSELGEGNRRLAVVQDWREENE